MSDDRNPAWVPGDRWQDLPASIPNRATGGTSWLQGHYWAVPKDPDDRIDCNDAECVYIYFDGRYSVLRLGNKDARRVEDFSRWFGPIEVPALPQESRL